MYLKSIVGLSQEDIGENNAIYLSLRERGLLDFDNAFEGRVYMHSGYGTNTYQGKVKDGVTLTELEIAMICDRGFSWFGGDSRLNPDGTFYVTIYFD